MSTLVQLIDPSVDASGLPTYKPEYQIIFGKEQSVVNTLLAYQLAPSATQATFLSKMPFYFVNGDFSHLRSRIDPIFKSLKAEFKSPTLPSKPEITALSVNGPLSLFAILRMHMAFEYVRKNIPALSALIHNNTNQQLIGPGTVIPSIRHVDPNTLRSYRRTAGPEKALISAANIYIQTKIHLNHGSVRYLPWNLFSERLEKGEPLGNGNRAGGIKHFRITTACAIVICHAVTKLSDQSALMSEVNTIFPEDPSAGPGQGLYTIPLASTNGNQIYKI